jgi:putative salt-induced outer membrane protein YdiY
MLTRGDNMLEQAAKFTPRFIATAMFLTMAAQAQPAQAPEPPPVWSGNFGAGLAITNGNTDTKNVNLSLGVVRDPKKRSVLRLNGLYLRGDKQSVLIVNQTQFTVRDEINLSTRTFVFAQGNYVKDTFKGINNLYSPSVGIGYRFINTDAMLLSLDNGIGGVWESDVGRPRVATGAYNAGERFSWKVSPSATITQSIASLWKTNDWADSLHIFTGGLAVSVTMHSEVKIELLDSIKNRPPPGVLKKNDTSLITALVWKF